MIRFQAFGIRFTLPLLTLIVPLLASRLGMQGSAAPMILALTIHELSHIAAAKLAHVEITEIRLTPFGGSARMENPYLLPPGRLLFVAAAGSFSNFALILVFSTLAQWNILPVPTAALYIHFNLILCLFNLLPALPLDGGRILYSLLAGPLGSQNALQTGIWTGRLLAALLLLTAFSAGLRCGVWNLTLILASVFIFVSGQDEREALTQSRAEKLHRLLRRETRPQPARFYQLDADTKILRALEIMRPRESAWFVLTQGGVPESIVDGRSILEYLLKNNAPDTPLGELPGRRPLPGNVSGAYSASESV